MEERLNKIAENMTEEQAEAFEDSFSDFGADSAISEETDVSSGDSSFFLLPQSVRETR